MRIGVRPPILVAVGRVLLLWVEDYHRPSAEVRRRDRTAIKAFYKTATYTGQKVASSKGKL